MCHLHPYKNVSRYKFFYKTRVLDNSYLQFKFQLPTSDSTQITAGGPKVSMEVPDLAEKYICT